MTTAEIISYYSGLLILQYRGQPKAVATVEALVGPVIMDQLPLLVNDAFSVDTAVGVQLDILGKYAGISRVTRTFTSQVTLNDDDYRKIMKMKIVINNSFSSLYDIQNLINRFFPGEILVFDYENMAMDYWIDSGQISLELAEVFIRNGLLPKPMAVQLGSTIYAPITTTFFGFRTYTINTVRNAPFNSYSSYVLTRPWLNYSNCLTM